MVLATAVGALLGGDPAGAVSAQTLGRPSPAQTLEQLRRSTMRPLPPLPPAARLVSDSRWVPDRHAWVPGVGTVFVPGHWERQLSARQVYVPPLVGVAPDGTTVFFPGSTLPPAEQRQVP